MDIDSVLVFLFLSLYFLQKGVVLRQSVLWRGDVGLLGREGNEEGVLKSVEVSRVGVLRIGVLLLSLMLLCIV